MVFEKKRKLERRYTVYRGGRKITKKERFTPSRSALSVSLKEPVNGSSKDLPSSLQADCPTIVEKGDNTDNSLLTVAVHIMPYLSPCNLCMPK